MTVDLILLEKHVGWDRVPRWRHRYVLSRRSSPCRDEIPDAVFEKKPADRFIVMRCSSFTLNTAAQSLRRERGSNGSAATKRKQNASLATNGKLPISYTARNRDYYVNIKQFEQRVNKLPLSKLYLKHRRQGNLQLAVGYSPDFTVVRP